MFTITRIILFYFTFDCGGMRIGYASLISIQMRYALVISFTFNTIVSLYGGELDIYNRTDSWNYIDRSYQFLPHQWMLNHIQCKSEKHSKKEYHLRQLNIIINGVYIVFCASKRLRILNPKGKVTGRAVPFHTQTFDYYHRIIFTSWHTLYRLIELPHRYGFFFLFEFIWFWNAYKNIRVFLFHVLSLFEWLWACAHGIRNK